MMTARTHRSRSAFTLIELLMVLAIIGVLVSLLMAAVFKATGKGDEVVVRNDIAQLQNGVNAFMTKFSVKDPPPSRLWLAPGSFYDPANPIHVDSKEYLTRVWPRLDLVNATWGGPTGVELQGHQCLVFFLGGMATSAGMDGFSTDPRQPYKTGGDRIRVFDFNASRLDYSYHPSFPAYKDAYGKGPYLYFSSYKGGNGYNRYFKYPGPQFRRSDCHSVIDGDKQTVAVWPYAIQITDPPTMAGKYLKGDTFQIISAGSDGLFGTGTKAAPPPVGPFWTTNAPMYQAGPGGYDDMSNFHDKLLGIPD